MGRRKPKKKAHKHHAKENREENKKAPHSSVHRDNTNTMLYLGPLTLSLQTNTNTVVTSTPCTNSSQVEASISVASSRNQCSAKASTVLDAMAPTSEASCSLRQSKTANEFISPSECKNVTEQECVENLPEIEYEVNNIRYVMTEGDAQWHNLIQGTLNMVADHPGCTGDLKIFRASKRGTGPVCSLYFKCTMCPLYVYKMKI